MNRLEFDEWFKYHGASFTSLHSWLAKYDGCKPGIAEILANWFRVLRPIELADAKAGTDALFAGEVEKPKGGFDDHPALIARLGRKKQRRVVAKPPPPGPRIIDGVETCRCLKCRDYGLRTVWHPETMARVAKNLPGPLRTASVRCTCEAGDRWQCVQQSFDATWCIEPEPGRLESQREALAAAIARLAATRSERFAWKP